MLTRPPPPLDTSATVPFRWEEEPGKPHPRTAHIATTTLSDHHHPTTTTTRPRKYSLELPPRLQKIESKMTKTPSFNTVLDGPYLGKPMFRSSSLRFKRELFGSRCGSPERVQLGAMVIMKRIDLEDSKERERERGFFGSWGRKQQQQQPTLIKGGGKREFGEGSFVFSSSSTDFSDIGGK